MVRGMAGGTVIEPSLFIQVKSFLSVLSAADFD
jgi:hypothetical protein